MFFLTNYFFGSLLFSECVFFEAILLKTVGFGALQNLLLSKAEGFRDFREILGLKVERDCNFTSCQETFHEMVLDDVCKNFGAKVVGFQEFLFFENHGFCFWKHSAFEIWKV